MFLLQHADALPAHSAHYPVFSKFPAGPGEPRKCFRKPWRCRAATIQRQLLQAVACV